MFYVLYLCVTKAKNMKTFLVTYIATNKRVNNVHTCYIQAIEQPTIAEAQAQFHKTKMVIAVTEVTE